MPVDLAMDTLSSSMVAISQRQDVIANNLANVNTTGFRKDDLAFKSVLNDVEKQYETAERRRGDMYDDVYYGYVPVDVPVYVEGQYSLQERGVFVKTDNPLDLAIDSDGFFAVETSDGVRYTRAGNFTIDKDGYLATQDGARVVGAGGPVLVSGGEVNVLGNGEVQVDGELRGVLKIVEPSDVRSFVKEDNSMYRFEGSQDGLLPVAEPRLQPGVVESSNVNSVIEINAMTVNMRTFEASNKAIKAMEQSLTRLINSVGKPN